LLNPEELPTVGAGSDTVKKRKSVKKKKEIVLNLSGVKFEDALRKMLKTPPQNRKK